MWTKPLPKITSQYNKPNLMLDYSKRHLKINLLSYRPTPYPKKHFPKIRKTV